MLSLILVLLFCSTSIDQGGWSEQGKKAFITGCLKNTQNIMNKEQSMNYCNCMLLKFIEKFPSEEGLKNIRLDEINLIAQGCLTP